jgi:hypothetical protein
MTIIPFRKAEMTGGKEISMNSIPGIMPVSMPIYEETA